MTMRRDPWWWAAVGAAMLAGLALRLLAARGGLWTDEAWSVILAEQAHDPAGVFLRINHDNNHHLYSLWLQAIGATASPMLARLPAIVAGTVAIPLAAVLLARWSRGAGIVGAFLFALSPVFVTFGSEARGYALMIVAVLTMLLVLPPDGRQPPSSVRWWLALTTLVGMFSHLTMIAPVALVTLWIYLDRRRAVGPRHAMVETVKLMGPALATATAVIAFVVIAATLSPLGMRLGGYLPFVVADFTAALDELSGWTIGLSYPLHWIAPLLIAGAVLWLALRSPSWLGNRALLYALLILAIPVGAALVRPGNAGFSRYYLLSAIGLTLLAAEWLARGLAVQGRARVAAGIAALLLTAVMMIGDVRLIAMQRGRPDDAFRAIASARPQGSRIALEPKRLEAIVGLPARAARYPLGIARGCETADFVLSAPPRWAPVPASVDHCGKMLTLIASAQTSPLTGDTWALYRPQSLPITQAPVSGPAPRRATSARIGRAGVAQG